MAPSYILFLTSRKALKCLKVVLHLKIRSFAYEKLTLYRFERFVLHGEQDFTAEKNVLVDELGGSTVYSPLQIEI